MKKMEVSSLRGVSSWRNVQRTRHSLRASIAHEKGRWLDGAALVKASTWRAEVGGRAKRERDEAKVNFPSMTVCGWDKGTQAGSACGRGKPWRSELVGSGGLKVGDTVGMSRLCLNWCQRGRFERCHLQ
jgi:hypothetical protein